MIACKHLRFLPLFLICWTASLAQPVDNMQKLKPAALKKYGLGAARIGDTYSAIDLFSRYLELKPEDMKIAYERALQYRKARDYETAQSEFKKVYEADPEKYTKALFYQAQMMKMNGEYEESKKLFEKFQKEYRGAKDEKLYRNLTKNEIQGCKDAPDLINKPLDILIYHLDTSINKAHVEFSPVSLTESRMLYASLKSDQVNFYPGDSTHQMPVRKFYTAEKEGDDWKSKGEYEGPFNLENVQTGNGAFSPDGQAFFFTRCEKNEYDRVTCSIYRSELKDGSWSEPEKLPKPINHPKYTSTQPTVGSDSKSGSDILYFVSDRPGGKGGLDIWYAVYNAKRKEWQSPKRAGRLNTEGDEMTPSYDIETRTMYFSSDGYPSLGGLDIFKVPGEKSRWKKAENMGYPLNSSADDLYYTISKDRSEGFFVSNRPGGVALKNPTCCDDIYSLKWTKYIRVALAGKVFQVDDSSKVESIEQILQKGSNADQEKFKPVERAVVSLFLLDPSGEEEPMFIKSDTTDANGDYSITMEQGQDYRVTISKDEYLSRSNNFSTKSFTKSDTLKWNAPIVAIPPEPIIIRNIYYHFDKSNLTDSAMMTIDTTIYRIMTENPEIVAEISSHTDSRGTDTYNEKLSQKRAESVVKYLISKGIASERLKAKGYGESKPLAPNENPDGSDNPEGRAKNRRTEFKVIGRIKNVSDVNYKE